MTEFQSHCAVVYISGKGHRQWPSVAESTILFIARCVGKAREEFIRQLADLRRRQRVARKEDEEAAQVASREAARQAAKGDGPSEPPLSLADIVTARQKEDRLRYWTAPFKWGPNTRDGPPLERLVPMMSIVDILTVPVFGGKADAEKLWPEGIAMGSWSDVGEPARWEEIWKQRNKRPHDIWVTQGVGEGLPILVPLAQDPRADRFLMDQLVDTGSRTVEGMAAVNGEMIRKMGVPVPGKGNLLPFEEACQNLKEARDGLWANPNLGFNHEKTMVKLPDEYSAFKDKKGSSSVTRKGNPHDDGTQDQDDEVDFGGPDDEEEPPKAAKPEEEGEAPEYEDMVDGPLPARGWAPCQSIWGSRVFHGRRLGQLLRRCILGWKARMDLHIAIHLREVTSRQ